MDLLNRRERTRPGTNCCAFHLYNFMNSVPTFSTSCRDGKLLSHYLESHRARTKYRLSCSPDLIFTKSGTKHGRSCPRSRPLGSATCPPMSFVNSRDAFPVSIQRTTAKEKVQDHNPEVQLPDNHHCLVYLLLPMDTDHRSGLTQPMTP